MEELKRWNLTLKNSLVEVRGRVLPPEPIKSSVRGYDGGTEADWTKSLRALPMFTCAVMSHWAILTPQENVKDVQTFVQTLMNAGKGMSFILPQPMV